MTFTDFDHIDFSNIKDLTKETKMAMSQIRSSGVELGLQALAFMFLGKLPKSFELEQMMRRSSNSEMLFPS